MKPINNHGFSQSSGRMIGLGVLVGCLLLPLTFLALNKSNSHQLAILSLQLSIQVDKLSTMKEESVLEQPGTNLTSLSIPLKAVKEQTDSVANLTSFPRPLKITTQNESVVNQNNLSLPLIKMQEHTDLVIDDDVNSSSSFHEKPQGNNSNAAIGVIEQTHDLNKKPVKKSLPLNLKVEASNSTVGNNIVPESKLLCDRSESRSDTCYMLGDVRVLGKSSTILLASSSQSQASSDNSTLKIRPYARKWEMPTMEWIKELTLKQEKDVKDTTSCSVNHSVPAVIFSTGGFLGNVFHDFTDVLVPLFATSHQFQGEVQFLATDFNSRWVDRYQRILKQLSHYEIINMDIEDQVHCFGEVHVGLKSHKVFGIDPSKTPNGYSMLDFKQLLRASFSLDRESTKKIVKPSKKKPRLLMILRKGSRSLMNAKEVIKMARGIGYKVVTTAPEDTKDLANFAKIVNSCDVMMGVHGAGLANMAFLPTNATILQIIPWGNLKWACRHDFGEPAPDMGLNYVEYEIKEEESSLIEVYPRDHAVFTDPASIQNQGWNMLWSIFLDKQKVKLDVGRFRGVLLNIYQNFKQ